MALGWMLGIGGLLLLGVAALLFNSLVSRKNQVHNAFAGVDALLKRRYDLIPNLVASVQAYMKHEQGVLQQLTELRARAAAGGLPDEERVDVENRISRALGSVRVAVESYPELKADRNVLQLQAALNEAEEQIAAGRRAYNAAVTDYNNAVEMLPTNALAALMGYRARTLFEIPEAERGNVDVGALFGKP